LFSLPKLLFIFFLANSLIVFYLLKKNFNRKTLLDYRMQELQEKLNILANTNSKELKNNEALRVKINNYIGLRKIVEEINSNLSIDFVATYLLQSAFSLIARNKGTCVLYLVDNLTQDLSLFKTKKQHEELVIKAKKGDIFDLWVLKHAAPLLIEDIAADFRFDRERLKVFDSRPIQSLISSCLLSEQRVMGILRLDSPEPGFYSQDDLRLLVKFSDLGAVALENSELFQKTQDLAIHDDLTSLFTKGYFLERLKEEFKRSSRHSSTLSLLMVDIDLFKKYNDQFGHTAGDLVLRNLSSAITQSLNDLNPIISRFGGEEFCICLPYTDKFKAIAVASILREKIEKQKIILRRQETNITVSIGVAVFPDDAVEENELVQKADKAMYEAKKQGRNRVVAC
jgi:diguanylate cyclase (GGDEF)-like protein